MSTSPNAGFNLQVTGSNNGIWGTNLNSNFSIADGIYGGRVTVNCAGSANITLSTSQAQNFFQNLTGALTGSILYILPATGGQFFILNNTTGAYTVTVVNNAAGTGVVVPQGGSAYVASDPDVTTVYGVIPTALSLSSLSVSGQITSTVTTGTAPFVVASTTAVANLSIGGNAATATTASTVTTNANLTGDITSVGNATTIATVNSNVGTFINASMTVNGKGQVTAASTGVIPQNSQSAAYTTVLADNGYQIYHPSADTTARTWTIDSNANVAYPIGATITFINDTSAGVITIAITSDTLVFAGTGTTGSRTLAASGIATAVKMTSTRWMISGSGLT